MRTALVLVSSTLLAAALLAGCDKRCADTTGASTSGSMPPASAASR